MQHTYTVVWQESRSTMEVDVELGNDFYLRDDQTIKNNPPQGMAVVRYCDQCGERYTIYFDSPHFKKWTCSKACRNKRDGIRAAKEDGNLDERLEQTNNVKGGHHSPPNIRTTL